MPAPNPGKKSPGVFALALGGILLLYFLRAHYEVPVLMYHHVQESEGASPNVRPQTFERQMEFLKTHHYQVVPLADLVRALRAGKTPSLNTVAVTFDDGNLDNFTNAFPILKKMGFPATVFMITGNINQEGWLGEEDLRVLDSSGVTIGSHTANHAYLPDLGLEEAAAEIRESKKRLEEILGHPVTLLSYPAGGFNEAVRALAQREGYEGAVTTNHGRKRHDPLALHRIKATEADGNLFRFWAKTTGFYQMGKKRVETE